MKFLTFCFLIYVSFLACATDESGTTPTPELHQPSVNNPLIAVSESPLQWHYVAKDDMFSRDGTTTGYLANFNTNSTKVLVYLVGGGACYNAITCENNPNSFDAAEASSSVQQLNDQPFGLNDRNDTNNIFADWNHIIIPYSTGDVHLGTNASANVPNSGPENQKMTGYTNFTQVADDLLDFYGANGITEFVVTGSSAGGFGTYLNFIQMAERFPNAQKTGLVDAGPMFLDDVVWNDCLCETWTNLWDFNFPNDFDSVVQDNYNYDIQGVYAYLALKYPEANFGLISDLQDSTIRYFYSYGQMGCTGQIGNIDGETYENALMNLKDHLTHFENWHVYYVPDDNHTFLGSERYQNIAVNGISMMDWIENVTNGTANDVIPN